MKTLIIDGENVELSDSEYSKIDSSIDNNLIRQMENEVFENFEVAKSSSNYAQIDNLATETLSSFATSDYLYSILDNLVLEENS